MSDTRWSLTSSERHGIIALAILILAVIMTVAVGNGTFRPRAEQVQATVLSEETTDSLGPDSIKKEVKTSAVPKPRKNARTRKKQPTGKSRNYLDEPAD